MSAAGPRNATFYHLNDPEMAEPSPSELIRLLARFADLGVLEAPQVVSAIGDMAGSPTDPDPGAATLLDALEDHRNSTSAAMPAVNTVIDQVKRMRHAAADRFHRQNRYFCRKRHFVRRTMTETWTWRIENENGRKKQTEIFLLLPR